MSLSTLMVILTMLIALYGLLWHDETADGVRNQSPNRRHNSSRD